VTEYSEKLSSQCNLTAQIEQVQDNIRNTQRVIMVVNTQRGIMVVNTEGYHGCKYRGLSWL
jgi:GTP cyclohydrolase I